MRRLLQKLIDPNRSVAAWTFQEFLINICNGVSQNKLGEESHRRRILYFHERIMHLSLNQSPTLSNFKAIPPVRLKNDVNQIFTEVIEYSRQYVLVKRVRSIDWLSLTFSKAKPISWDSLRILMVILHSDLCHRFLYHQLRLQRSALIMPMVFRR